LLLTDDPEETINQLKQTVARGEAHPKEVKLSLATRIVNDFHEGAGEKARVEWDKRHSVSKMDRVQLDIQSTRELAIPRDGLTLERVLAAVGLAESSSEAGRKIKQGAVSTGDADAEYVDDLAKEVVERRRMSPGKIITVKIGRAAHRINLKSETAD
jgi:tyrosyl-tRNA synthetase